MHPTTDGAKCQGIGGNNEQSNRALTWTILELLGYETALMTVPGRDEHLDVGDRRLDDVHVAVGFVESSSAGDVS